MLKQSERAATPFLISKQPYFLPFFYVAASSFSVSHISPASLWFSLFASLADLSPQLISQYSTFLRSCFVLLSSFVLFSPTFAILSLSFVFVLVLLPSHYRATFDPRVISIAWPALFISTPLPPLYYFSH